MNTAIQTIIGGFTLGSQYALMALGFSLIFGILGVINFAHGAFYVLGGYIAYASVTSLGLPFFVAVLIAFLGAGLVGYLFELIVIEPRVDDHYATIILTLGLSLLLATVVLYIFGPQSPLFQFPVSGVLRIGQLFLPLPRLIIIGVGVVVIGLTWAILFLTDLGRALRALADDREMARVQGMRPKVLFPLAFGLSTGLAGLTGALVTPVFALAPFVGERVLLVSFVAVILGGLTSLPGAILAAFIVGMIESVAGVYIGGSIAPLLMFVLIMLVLVFRPSGLLGVKNA